jgi:hypothetical protein
MKIAITRAFMSQWRETFWQDTGSSLRMAFLQSVILPVIRSCWRVFLGLSSLEYPRSDRSFGIYPSLYGVGVSVCVYAGANHVGITAGAGFITALDNLSFRFVAHEAANKQRNAVLGGLLWRILPFLVCVVTQEPRLAPLLSFWVVGGFRHADSAHCYWDRHGHEHRSLGKCLSKNIFTYTAVCPDVLCWGSRT